MKKREQRRICTREYYRNYFLFGRDPDRVSRAEIEAALTNDTPKASLKKLIERLEDKQSRRGISRVGALLDQIFEIVFTKPLLTRPVVQAILELSDELIAREDMFWELFVTSNFDRLDNILQFGLEPLSVDQRIDLAKFMASHSSGLSICTRVVEHLAGQHGLHGHKASFDSDRLIPLADAKKAAAKILARIRKAARTGQLLSDTKPMFLIWAWRRLSKPSEVKSWLTGQMRNDAATLRIAEVLPQASYRSGGNEQKITYYFKAESYKEILDVNALKRRVEKIAKRRNSSSSAKRIYAAFLAAETAGRDA